MCPIEIVTIYNGNTDKKWQNVVEFCKELIFFAMNIANNNFFQNSLKVYIISQNFLSQALMYNSLILLFCDGKYHCQFSKKTMW